MLLHRVQCFSVRRPVLIVHLVFMIIFIICDSISICVIMFTDQMPVLFWLLQAERACSKAGEEGHQ